MSSPIPQGFLIQKIEIVPPEVKINSGRVSRFNWLRERVLEMKVNNGSLQITAPNLKEADAAKHSIASMSRKIGSQLSPPREWKVYTAHADNKENGLYHVFIECKAVAKKEA